MRSVSTRRNISAIVGISIASVLLLLSFCGRYMDYGVARSIFNFFVGSFGISFYGMMIGVIVGCSMVLIGKRIIVPVRYILCLSATFILIVLIVHTYSSLYLFDLSFDSYITACYNYYVVPTFGGVVWGTVCYGLVSGMTIWGASVLLLVLLAINLIFVANFCYDVATHRLILDRRVEQNISRERNTLDTPMSTPVLDSAESARREAISILFDKEEDSYATTPQQYSHAPISTVNDVINTIEKMEHQSTNNNTTVHIHKTEDNDTINIGSFFGDDDSEEDFIVPSMDRAEVSSNNNNANTAYGGATREELQNMANKLANNDVSVADIMTHPTHNDSVVANNSFSYDIDEDISGYNNRQYIDDNDLDQDMATYTEPVTNDVVAQSNQSDSFGDNNVFTIQEIQKPVKGGVQMGFGLEDTQELKKKQSAIHQYAKYERPPVELLDDIVITHDNDDEYRRQAFAAIVSKLHVYGIDTEPVEAIVGPTVTQYRLRVLSEKTRMSVFASYVDDLKSCLASADDIRIEAPIPGTSLVGIEVANNTRRTVKLRSMLESDEFNKRKTRLNFAIGQDISGRFVCYDLTEMPHLLIAGTTGSGKSVVLNNLIVSMMYKYSPEYLRFIMVDPKYVELSRYNGSPHLLTSEAITAVSDALASMDYLISEMENRFQLFRTQGVSTIFEYNMKINPSMIQKLPYIVLVVDELADLMSSNKKAFEAKILRLAQKSRACGIHIVLATQRPSVDIVTGTIKSNLPARIALKVATGVDSKTILGFGGAENLLGKGDMLFVNGASSNTTRIQGAYVDNDEIARVVQYAMAQNEVFFPEEAYKSIFVSQHVEEEVEVVVADKTARVDSLCKKALHLWLTDKGFASISSIQRKLGIGFNRAGKIVETLVAMGYVEEPSASDTSGKRRVLVTLDQLDDLFPDQTID